MIVEGPEQTFYCLMYTFLVRRHFYMPRKRAYEKDEKILRKNYTILFPKKYYEYFNEFGHARKNSSDWASYDKMISNQIVKSNQGF